MTPAITVLDKLFVSSATSNVGIKTNTFIHCIVTMVDFFSKKPSITNADNIQTGMYASHLKTILGNFIFLTNTKGNILGIHVTRAQPKINNTIAMEVVIFP